MHDESDIVKVVMGRLPPSKKSREKPLGFFVGGKIAVRFLRGRCGMLQPES
jgi:hypothetical protein